MWTTVRGRGYLANVVKRRLTLVCFTGIERSSLAIEYRGDSYGQKPYDSAEQTKVERINSYILGID